MNWKDKHNLFFKLLRLHFGLALYSIGLTLGIQANIGLAPWEAFGIDLWDDQCFEWAFDFSSDSCYG